MSEIVQLQAQLEFAKSVVEQRDLVSKLSGNREFKKLIVDGFCKEECARFTHNSTDISMSVEDRADSLGMAQAGGYLKRWMNFLIIMGNRAEQDIVQMNETLAELRAEEKAED